MPYPSAGPDPTDPTAARMYLDDGYLPSRGILVAEPDMNTGDHAQAHENSYRAAMLAEARVGSGWVPAPVGTDGLSPVTFTAPAILTDGTHPITPTATSCGAFTTVASADVSSWLSVGTKVRCRDTGASKDFIVIGVTGTGVALLGKVNTTLAAIDNGSVLYGAHPADFSYNRDDWTISFVSGAVDQNPDLTPLNSQTVYAGTGAISVPPGEWEVGFALEAQLSLATSNPLQLQAGLATSGVAVPDDDLHDEVFINPAQDVRHVFQRRAPRHLTSITSYSMHLYSGASGLVANSGNNGNKNSVTITQTRMRSRWWAISTLI